LLLFPLAMTFRQPVGRSRQITSAYSGVVALIGAIALVLLIFNIKQLGSISTLTLCRAFFWGSILSTWLSAFLGSSRIGQ
jgi:hypothetical protein